MLNFDNTDIKDVLKGAFGDMLQIDYSVDPAVHGNISLHTAKGIGRSSVLPVFEDALRVARVVLIRIPPVRLSITHKLLTSRAHLHGANRV